MSCRVHEAEPTPPHTVEIQADPPPREAEDETVDRVLRGARLLSAKAVQGALDSLLMGFSAESVDAAYKLMDVAEKADRLADRISGKAR